MAFDNFTVNIVSFPETAGVDWTLDNPSIVLTLVPDAGYSISAANFSATTPLPNYVSSVIFTQNGSNIDCVINYTVPSVMPSVDVLVSLCATGFAEATAITVSGTIKDCGTSNISLPKVGDLPDTYSGSGNWDSTQTVFTGSDDNSATLSYTLGLEQVYLNGVKLVSGDDYVTTSTSTITLQEDAVQGDDNQYLDPGS